MARSIIKTCAFVFFVHSIGCEPTNSTSSDLTDTTVPENTSANVTDRPAINDTIDIIRLMRNLRGKCGFEYEIIDVVAGRSEEQRLELINFSTLHYKKDLIEMLSHRFIGDTYTAMVALLTPHQKLYARELHDSVNGLGTDEHAISEILGSMDASEIAEVSAIYLDEYNATLKEDLIADTSGSFKDLIIALCDNLRNESGAVDEKATKFDVRALKAASKGNDIDANEKTFISILTSRSYPQLKAIFNKFKKHSNYTILEAIENRFEGDLQYGLLVIAKNVLLSKSDFYAGQLEEALSSVLYDDHQLTRIIVGRSEIDLNDIQKAYKNIYGTELVDKIATKTGGAYKRLLITILNKSNSEVH